VIEIRRTTLGDWQTWRELRLNALRLAPTAYGETYANAIAGDDHYWQGWWGRFGDAAVRTLAFLDGTPAGQIACLPVPEFDEPLIIAMWVEEHLRGRGVADALVADTLDWLRDHGYAKVRLGVTEGNETARKLYLRHGFTGSGQREPLHSHPDLLVEWMLRAL